MSQFSRPVAQVVTPEPVTEGCGVHLRRSIGTRGLGPLDPFLLLDHFESVNSRDYAEVLEHDRARPDLPDGVGDRLAVNSVAEPCTGSSFGGVGNRDF